MKALAIVLCVAAACSESPFGSFKSNPEGTSAIGKFVPASAPYCVDIRGLGMLQPVGLGNGDQYFYIADADPSVKKLYAVAVPTMGTLQVAGSQTVRSIPTDVSVDGLCPYVASAASIDPVTFSDTLKGFCGSSEPTYPIHSSLIAFQIGELIRAGTDDMRLERYLSAAPFTSQDSIALPVQPVRIATYRPLNRLLVAYQTSNGWALLAYEMSPFKLRGRIEFPWPSYEDLAGLVGPNAPGDQHLYAYSANQHEFCVFSYVPGG